MTSTSTPITFLGLGAMGGVLAGTVLDAGHPVTAWNRSPGRADELAARGAAVAGSAAEAVAAAPVVVACLFDHGSVHETLDPLVADLGCRLVPALISAPPAGSIFAAPAAPATAPAVGLTTTPPTAPNFAPPTSPPGP